MNYMHTGAEMIDLKHCYAFIDYNNRRDAEDAVHAMNGREIDGERIVVEWTRGNTRGRGRGYRPERSDYRVRIENLPEHAHWQDLKDYFRRAGDVIYGDINGTIGVIEFRYPEDVPRAIKEFDRTRWNGSTIYVSEDSTRRHGRKRGSRSRSDSRSRSPRSRSRSRSRGYRRSPPRRRHTKSRSKSRDRSPSVSPKRKSPSPSKSPRSKPKKHSSKSPSPTVKRRSPSGSPKRVRSDSKERRSPSKSRSRSPEPVARPHSPPSRGSRSPSHSPPKSQNGEDK